MRAPGTDFKEHAVTNSIDLAQPKYPCLGGSLRTGADGGNQLLLGCSALTPAPGFAIKQAALRLGKGLIALKSAGPTSRHGRMNVPAGRSVR